MAGEAAVAATTGSTEVQKKNRNTEPKSRIPKKHSSSTLIMLRYCLFHLAITTVGTIAEILKNNGLATEKKVLTSTVGMRDENKGRFYQKAKMGFNFSIEIVLGKPEKFDSLMTAPAPAPEIAAKDKD